MPNYRDMNHHVNFLAGTSGMNGKPGGRIFWVGASGYTAVNGAAPSDGNNGLSPPTAFATIQKGLDACTSGRGDTVAILPGSYTVTASIAVTQDDVRICSAVPVGPREYGPVIITGAATLDTPLMTVNANNVDITGIVFECGFTTVTANRYVVNVKSTNNTTDYYGFNMRNCYFDGSRAAGAASAADSDMNMLNLGTDSNDRIFNALIEGCVFKACDQDAITLTAAPYATIRNCAINDGNASELMRYGVNVGSVNATITDCTITVGDTATPGAGIYFNSTLGQADNNRIWARGNATRAILYAASATAATHGNVITFVTTGGTAKGIDFTTDNTSPSNNCDQGTIFNTTPGIGVFVTPSIT